MQFGQGRPPVGIVFDCDMGNGIDDALALAMLFGFQGKNECRVISMSVTKPNLNAAAFTDVISRFYLGEPSPFSGGNPPVGLTMAGKHPEDTPMITAPLARVNAEGKPAFVRDVRKINDTADPLALMRNALSAQFDQNAVVVLGGPATNLVHLLDLPGARAVVSQKVRYLTVAAGAYPSGGPESAIQADIASAKRLFAEWPTAIVAVGSEVGDALPFPGASIDKDFAWSPAHPIVDAYRANKPMPYDAPSYSLSAVLHAVRPKEGYFSLSGPGTVTVLDDGRTRFTPSPDGKHQYLVVDPAQKERVLQTFTEIASLKPAGRPMRFRPQQKKDDAAKK